MDGRDHEAVEELGLHPAPVGSIGQRGQVPVEMLDPKAKETIQPFRERDVEAYLFTPLEAQRQRWMTRRTRRHQPVVERKTARRPRDCYHPKNYGACIRRTCRAIGVPPWSPNRLRHNAATRLRAEFGPDLAQVVLGHSSADVTELYAQLDLAKAILAMERAG